MTKIKICGITNYTDAKNAVDLGADFLGLNFYSRSPRFINLRNAKAIAEKLQNKSLKVGVFVNEKIDNIIEIADYCSLDLIQLSGNEDLSFVNALRSSTNKKIIKVFKVNGDKTGDFDSFNCDYFMLDTFKNGFYGGTGEGFDLNLANGFDSKRLFLAGGLNDTNVKEAIHKLNPFAVDVCSSTESSPGKKDFNKMKKFIEAVQ